MSIVRLEKRRRKSLAPRGNLAEIRRGLVSLWDIGRTRRDLGIGNSHSGPQGTAIVRVSTDAGVANDFPGSGSCMNVPGVVSGQSHNRAAGSGTGATMTFVARFRARGWGAGSYGRIWDSNDGGTSGFWCYVDNNNAVASLSFGSGAGWVNTGANTIDLNKWYTVVVTIAEDGGSTVYLNGVPTAYGSGHTVSANATPTMVGIGGNNRDQATRTFDGQISVIAYYKRALREAEAKNLSQNPWQMFAPARRYRPFFGPAAGGSSYSVAYDETATATDAFINTAIFAATLSEQATATDGSTNTATFAAVLSESGTATEGTDGTTAGATSGAISEQASATDSYGATMVAAASISEQASASDSIAGANTTSGAISESVTATDSLAGANTTSAAISEQATATDSSSNTLTATAGISESATASDGQTNTAVLNAAVSEQAQGTDFYFGSVPGAGAGAGASGNHDIVKMGRMMGRS